MRGIFASVPCLLLLIGIAVPAEPTKKAEEKSVTLEGKVQPLAKALEKLDVKADADTAGMALVTSDGTVYTIAKTKHSRLFFLDETFQKRTVRVTAKVLPGTQIVKVEKVQTVKDGKVYNVDYWCENCQLSWVQPGECECCGGETVLREIEVKEPAKKPAAR